MGLWNLLKSIFVNNWPRTHNYYFCWIGSKLSHLLPCWGKLNSYKFVYKIEALFWKAFTNEKVHVTTCIYFIERLNPAIKSQKTNFNSISKIVHLQLNRNLKQKWGSICFFGCYCAINITFLTKSAKKLKIYR